MEMLAEDKDREMDKEAEFYKRIVDGVFDFKNQQRIKDNKKYNPQISAPRIKDGVIEIVFHIPIEWIIKYTGKLDKDGVEQ